MKTMALPFIALAVLAACQSGDLGRVSEMNPFRRAAPAAREPAPIRAGDVNSERPPAPIAALPTGPAYEIPRGGENTISLSVTGCAVGCSVVNVMLDPDSYWQRKAPEDNTTGRGRAELYDTVANVFQANGFYAVRGAVNIMPENTDLCPDYQAGGQVFFMSLSRNSANRTIAFDTGCAGSATADAAADAINTLINVSDYMDIVSGISG
jgi:hypothetical protein